MFDYIDRLFVMVRPRKVLYMAIGKWVSVIEDFFISQHKLRRVCLKLNTFICVLNWVP